MRPRIGNTRPRTRHASASLERDRCQQSFSRSPLNYKLPETASGSDIADNGLAMCCAGRRESSPHASLADHSYRSMGREAYRMSVLTLAASMSYRRLTASLICGLLERLATMKTSVLLSSIFFMADSVVSGCWMMEWWSILDTRGADLRG